MTTTNSKIQGVGKIFNVACQDQSLQEFPELLFGSRPDGEIYFDATRYLKEKFPDSNLSVADFFKVFQFQIQAILDAYELPMQDAVIINTEGHQLIIGYLCYPFLSYTDPQFCAYINEIINEVFVNGFAVSDSYLIQNVQKRLSTELIKQLVK